MRTLETDVASELVTRELAPAIVAAVEQAQGGADGPGYFAEFTDSRTVLILPREVEALTARQIETLEADVDTSGSACAAHTGSARRIGRPRPLADGELPLARI